MLRRKSVNGFLILVIAIAANKSDLYDQEQVDEQKAKAFAKEIGAIFKSTSAKNASGIDVIAYLIIGYV
jgi:putative ribosome biogenesis GTPase RsgA